MLRRDGQTPGDNRMGIIQLRRVQNTLNERTSTLNKTSPLSSRVWTSAFAHRNPPRSLWLQHIHRMCCLTRRAHIAVPPLHKFEGTHGDRVAGDNANAIDFVTIASSLCATSSTRIDKDISLLVPPLRFIRQLRAQTAQSLVLSVKLGVRLLAALRLAFRLQIGTCRL